MMVCAVIDDSVELHSSRSSSKKPKTKSKSKTTPAPSNNLNHKHHHRPSPSSFSRSKEQRENRNAAPTVIAPNSWGHQTAKNAQSDKVKCVNNIVVLSDSSYVCPLFKMYFKKSGTPSIEVCGQEFHGLALKARKLFNRILEKRHSLKKRESSGSQLYSTFRRNPLQVLWE